MLILTNIFRINGAGVICYDGLLKIIADMAGENHIIIPCSIHETIVKPEKKHEYELGIENKFLNNRLGMEFSYYYNDIKDHIDRDAVSFLKLRASWGRNGNVKILHLHKKPPPFPGRGLPF